MADIFKPDSKDGKIRMGAGQGAAVHAAWAEGYKRNQQDRLLVASGLKLRADSGGGFLRTSIREAVKKNRHRASTGSTVAAALLTENGTLHAAGLGDSTITVFIHDPAIGDVTALQFTREHNLDNADEFNRIAGKVPIDPLDVFIHGKRGTIVRAKDGPRLVVGTTSTIGVTRAVGDGNVRGLIGKLDVYPAHPEKSDLRAVDLMPWLAKNCTIYIEASTDGVSGLSTLDERREAVRAALAQDPDADIAEALSRHAVSLGSTDDRSIVVVRLAPGAAPRNTLVVVADGHGHEGAEVAQSVVDTCEQRARATVAPRVRKPATRKGPKA